MFNITKNKKCNIKINDKAEIECVEKGSYIPKSRIEKKIEELEEEYKRIIKQENRNYVYESILGQRIIDYKELLESEE